MIKSFIIDLALTIGGAYVAYAIGNYLLFPNIGEANAAGMVFVAASFLMMGLVGLFSKVYGFFKAKK